MFFLQSTSVDDDFFSQLKQSTTDFADFDDTNATGRASFENPKLSNFGGEFGRELGSSISEKPIFQTTPTKKNNDVQFAVSPVGPIKNLTEVLLCRCSTRSILTKMWKLLHVSFSKEGALTCYRSAMDSKKGVDFAKRHVDLNYRHSVTFVKGKNYGGSSGFLYSFSVEEVEEIGNNSQLIMKFAAKESGRAILEELNQSCLNFVRKAKDQRKLTLLKFKEEQAITRERSESDRKGKLRETQMRYAKEKEESDKYSRAYENHEKRF